PQPPGLRFRDAAPPLLDHLGSTAHAPPHPPAAYASSVRGPKASGITSSIVRMPDTVSSSIPSAECSNSSWRQRPHGMRVCPWPSTHVKATSLPPPVICRVETSAHSAHSVSP